jgi:acyl-coenzyme A thioesterase PaaI-like protein
MNSTDCFQDHMPGNICFGCGRDNHEGLQISSWWDGEEGVCTWDPQKRYEGWQGLVNGGIMATLVDCHCMCTAMAHEAREAGRSLEEPPYNRFATGQMTIRYLKPAPADRPLEVRAHVTGVKDKRKYTLKCEVYSGSRDEGGQKLVEAEVIAFLVFSSDNPDHGHSPFGG